MLATWKVAPALAAGNTVVLKPLGVVPADRLAAGRHRRRGRPAARRPERRPGPRRRGRRRAGRPSRRQPRISFTGSVPTAKIIARSAAANLTPLSLELGGKSPFIVFADADLDLAVTNAVEQYDNAGQVCLAGTRLLVEESIGDEFVAPVPASGRRTAARATRATRRPTSAPCIHPDHLDRVDGFVAAGQSPRRDRAARRRPQHRARRPVLPADPVHRRRARQRDRHRGGVRPGARPADLRRPRTRPSRMANDSAFGLAAMLFTGDTRPRRTGGRPPGRRHRVGQLLLRARPACARSAAPVTPASAARAAPGRSTSTATSRTPCSRRPLGVRHGRSDRLGRSQARRSDRKEALMGEVVGAGLLAHVPTIALPEQDGASSTTARTAHWCPGSSSCAPRCSTPSTTTRSWCSTRTGRPRSSSSSPRRIAAPACSRRRSCRAACAGGRTTSSATRSWRTPIAGKADEHGTWITAIDDRPPADLLRHHQPLGVPRRGSAGQALDLASASARPPTPRTTCGSAARSATRSPSPTARCC